MFGETKFQWRYSRTVIETNHQHVTATSVYTTNSRKIPRRPLPVKALDEDEKYA